MYTPVDFAAFDSPTGPMIARLARFEGHTQLGVHSLRSGLWHLMTPDNRPEPARLAAAAQIVWTGSKLVAWGKGALTYDPATGKWERIEASPEAPLPAAKLLSLGTAIVSWSVLAAEGWVFDVP